MKNGDTAIEDESARAAALAAADDALVGGRGIDHVVDTAPFSADQCGEFRDEVSFIARVRAALGPSAMAPPGCPLPWTRLGRFHICRELGRGGMGIVFLADDPVLGRQVALKVPRPESLGTPEPRERFHREARAASALDHPNIVPVFEAGAEGPIHYLVAAYCAGPTLAAWLAARPEPVPLPVAADLVAALADGVGHAHDRGVVHRDLKPANVLLQPIDRDDTLCGESGAADRLMHVPRITDFGLAKLTDDMTATRSGTIVGTAAYMAPEQAAGRGAAIGRSADVYGLGAILYELLTGRPPFVGDSHLDVLAQVRDAEPAPPALLRRTIPRDLETVCLKCLRKEPDRRYAGAAELAADLRRWRRGEPILARPVSTREQIWRWCVRNPALASLAAVIVMLVTALAVGSSFAALWLRSERNAALAAEERSDRRGFDALLAQARAERWSGQAGRRFASLDAIHEAAAIHRKRNLGEDARRVLRTELLGCTPLVDVRSESAWDGYPPDGTALAFDSGFDRYAVGRGNGVITVHAVGTAEPLAELRQPNLPCVENEVAFSPDGKWLAARYVHDGQASLIVWDWRRGVVVAHRPPSPHYWPFDFHPDARRIAVGYPDCSVHICDLEGREEDQVLAADGPVEALPHYGWLRFDAGGGCLAVKTHGDSVRVWNVSARRLDGSVPQRWRLGKGSWGRDGSLLGIPAGHDVQIWDSATRTKSATLIGHQSGVIAVAFDPLKQFIASRGTDGAVRLWDIDAQCQVLEFASEHEPRFSRDGSRIVRRTGARLEIFALERGAECRRLAWPGQVAAFSADGAHLALAARTSGVRLIDLSADRCLAHWPIAHASAALVSPDRSGLWAVSETTGLHRLPWPNGADAPAVNPPQFANCRGTSIAGSRDGRRMVAVLDANVVPLDGATGAPLEATKGIWHGYFSALSPDGRYCASGPWIGDAVRVWEGESPTPVLDWQLPPQGSARVAFSPDGRLFAIGTDVEYLLFDVGSWTLRRRLNVRGIPVGTLAFSPDSRLLAVTRGRDIVLLFDAESGAEIAALPAVSPQIIWSLAFSPDGRYLAASTEQATTHLWDLHRIRARLAELGLDW